MLRQFVRRGDVWFVDLTPVVGSEQGGTRPVVVIQNDIGNKYSPTTVVAVLTTKEAKLPTHVRVDSPYENFKGTVMLEQLRTIDKKRLDSFLGNIDDKAMKEIDEALLISIGLSGVAGAG